MFSQWDRIFKNPMTTAAAVDRLVHHAVILEFDVPSFRTEAARKRTPKTTRAATTDDQDPAAVATRDDNYPPSTAAGDDNYPPSATAGDDNPTGA